jgi:hypothetical protein
MGGGSSELKLLQERVAALEKRVAALAGAIHPVLRGTDGELPPPNRLAATKRVSRRKGGK